MAIKTFTTGEVLTASDTNTYLANSGLVYVKQQAIGSTPVSSIAVTSAFSSTFDDYRIIISGVLGTVNNDTFLMQMTGSTGSTYKSTSFYMVYNNAAFNGVAFATSTSFRIGWTNNSTDMNYALDLLGPFAARPTFFKCDGANSTIVFQNGGEDTSSSSCTGFTLTPSSGTIAGGTIFVYGYRKA